MVNFEVPAAKSFNPSEVTPHRFINHDVTVDLDSSNAFEGPEKLLEVWFAPSADCLPLTANEGGLKAVAEETWVPMLDMVNCKVLSVLRSDHVDAYLLSESSMFVWPHKIILKTCGTTTLLLGLHRMLRIAAHDAGFPYHQVESRTDVCVAATPYRVFYSRKNFLFPDKQQGPHRSWTEEVKFLDDTFENGSAYMVGKMNGDHWYLYITSPSQFMTPPRTPEEGTFPRRRAKIPTGVLPFKQTLEESDDETLEILMTDLDPENAKQFYLEHASAVACDKHVSQTRGLDHVASNNSGLPSGPNPAGSMTASTASGSVCDETFDIFSHGGDSDIPGAHTPLSEQAMPECLMTEGHAVGSVVSESCGLADVYPASKYPGARIDSYLFTPCGFSANGLVPAPDSENGPNATHYFNVHVTPEPHCSYASFETNVPGGQKGQDTADIIDQVVNIFKPGRFTVTLFEAKNKVITPDPVDEERRIPSSKKRLERINGYKRMDRIVHDFDDYSLVFRFYERENWASEGGVRVGETML